MRLAFPWVAVGRWTWLSRLYVVDNHAGVGANVFLGVKMSKKKIAAANMHSRVRNEVKLHSRLHHPSILRLYHFFEDSDNVYLIMERCRSGELYRYLSNRRRHFASDSLRISEAEIRHVMLQIVRGVQYMHSLGIIHRDLKLSNMLITHDFDVKIADFGLAVQLENLDGEQLTMCGTPNYISPEVISRQPYGLASDLWSVGCMFYTMLCGRPPFDSPVVKSTLELVSKAAYDIPSHVGQDAVDLLRSLLQKQPHRRISAEEVLRHRFFKLPSEPLRSIPTTQSNLPAHTSLPTIDTSRLNQLKQATKHGYAEILPSGHIVLDFNEDKYRITISGDGKTILFYTKPIGENWSVYSKPTHTCSPSTIPEKYVKKYKYAAKFVDVVRSKTPKVIYYSPQAKCLLMENGPLADFDANFYNGSRISWHVARGDIVLKETSPSIKETRIVAGNPKISAFSSRMEVTSLGDQLSSLFTGVWEPMWKHVIDCYSQCWEVASKDSLDGFPVTLKTGSQPGSRSIENDDPNVQTSPRSGTVVPSVHISDIQSMLSPSAYAPSNFAGQNLTAQQSLKSMPTSHQLSTRVFNSDKITTTADRQLKMLNNMDYAHIDGIGWCIRRHLENGFEFAMLFNDGCRLIVEPCSQGSPHSQARYFRPQNGRGAANECHPIDRKLPSYIKERLSHFANFIDIMQKQ
eukprot:Partr_v1_DN28419_c0_g1_i7_m41558 putative Polo-like kinase